MATQQNIGLMISALLIAVGAALSVAEAGERNLIANGSLQAAAENGRSPAGFSLSGDASYGRLGQESDRIGHGIRLVVGSDLNEDGENRAALTVEVKNLAASGGRWFRFRVRGLAQDEFRVEQDDLFLRVDYFRDGGQSALDHVEKSIYPLIEQDRRALRDEGTNRNLGGAVWRSYDLEFHTPFPEVDTLNLSVGFGHGKLAPQAAEFWIDEVELTPIDVPADYQPPQGGRPVRSRQELSTLVPLGGRWYYDPLGHDRQPPAQFDYTNSDRLLYLSSQLEAPFADNMTAWLRAGYKDRSGKLAESERFVADNVRVSLTAMHLVIRSKNLPNHPTATFPDRWRSLDGNPNFIQEQDSTWYIPLAPRENPRHVAMKNRSNNDHALPMGPIGVAVNGVVFFNPFDHLLDEDAVWRLDRCCGHPAPTSMYHYHKYPVCIKSPWSDDGGDHSPLIGFAFDGFPVYGPYESAGQLAKDSASNPLNEFNVHEDPDRGWHYHVTPGKFPHVIGGFWGELDQRNKGRGGQPPFGPGKGPKAGPGRKGPPPSK